MLKNCVTQSRTWFVSLRLNSVLLQTLRCWRALFSTEKTFRKAAFFFLIWERADYLCLPQQRWPAETLGFVSSVLCLVLRAFGDDLETFWTSCGFGPVWLGRGRYPTRLNQRPPGRSVRITCRNNKLHLLKSKQSLLPEGFFFFFCCNPALKG